MNQLLKHPHTSHDGRIAFVQSCWHEEIVDQCRVAFVEELQRLGRPETLIDFFEVPGVFEIPLQAKLLARTGRYVAVVATGFVVGGGNYPLEFVREAVITRLMPGELDSRLAVT